MPTRDDIDRFKEISEDILAAAKRADDLFCQIVSSRGYPGPSLCSVENDDRFHISKESDGREVISASSQSQPFKWSQPVECFLDDTWEEKVRNAAILTATFYADQKAYDRMTEEQRDRTLLRSLLKKYPDEAKSIET